MKIRKKYPGILPALVVSLGLAACGGGGDDIIYDTVDGVDEEAPETIENLAIDDSIEYDYSAFLGKWVGTDGTTLTVEEDSGKGAPFVLLDRYGDPYTTGVFKFVEKYGCVYAVDKVTDVASKCWFNENGRLEIPGFSIFSKVTGDESDYIVLYGTWYLDGEEPPKKCIEFDSSGTMWSIYVRQDNGLLDGVNGGTLRETGANRYEAVSDWNDNETFDCYIKDDCLYWGSEDGGYEVYY